MKNNEDEKKNVITYFFVNGEHCEIEVSDEIAAVIAQFERDEHANDEKKRYHCYSLDECDYEGSDFAYEDEDLARLFEENKESKKLSVALSHLTKCQLDAIQAVFFEGLTQEKYAQKCGISHQMVSKHIKYAIKKLKKYF